MDCYYLKKHLYQILNSFTFKWHSYEDMPLLPWKQHFHNNKYYSGLLLPQGTCVLNMKFVNLQTAKISRYVSVAMVTDCPWRQIRAWIAVPSRDLCCKYEVHLSSNSKDISICLCCHGNKVCIATSHTMNSCCLKGSVYQIMTSYTFKQPSYKHCLCCYGNKVSIATSHTMDSCCLKRLVYQIRTSYTFKQRSYEHMPLLSL